MIFNVVLIDKRYTAKLNILLRLILNIVLWPGRQGSGAFIKVRGASVDSAPAAGVS
jgi:hypothetical protein